MFDEIDSNRTDPDVSCRLYRPVSDGWDKGTAEKNVLNPLITEK